MDLCASMPSVRPYAIRHLSIYLVNIFQACSNVTVGLFSYSHLSNYDIPIKAVPSLNWISTLTYKISNTCISYSDTLFIIFKLKKDSELILSVQATFVSYMFCWNPFVFCVQILFVAPIANTSVQLVWV